MQPRAKIRHAVGAGRVRHGVVALGVGQREVDVDAGAGDAREGLAQEGQVEAQGPAGGVGGGQHRLAGQQPEQEGVVGGPHGVAVLEGELELALVVLGVDRLHGDAGGFRPAHQFGDHPGGVRPDSGAVDHGPGRLVGPGALKAAAEHVGLELDADLGGVAEGLPVGHRPAQRVAGRHRQGLAVHRQVADHDPGGVVVPALADVGGVEADLGVGQAVEQVGAGCGRHAAVVAEREHAHAVAGALVGQPGGQVLAPGQPEVVGPEHPDAVPVGHGSSPVRR